MDRHDATSNRVWTRPAAEVSEVTIAQLVGEVYEEAPPVERSRILEPLLRPLGVLSLAIVANGIFARIRLQSGWQDLCIRPDDLHNVHAADVVALVDFAQQASASVLERLAQTLAASPVLAGSATVALLLAILVKRVAARGDREDGEENERYAA